MSGYDRLKDSHYRSIIFLCQECGGDLEQRPVTGSARCRFECQRCGLVFVYGSSGWERYRAGVPFPGASSSHA